MAASKLLRAIIAWRAANVKKHIEMAPTIDIIRRQKKNRSQDRQTFAGAFTEMRPGETDA